jgi:hypothetical protein
MKNVLLFGVLLAMPWNALADEPSKAPTPQSLASTLGVYVFPTKGQDASQQSEDEASCYQWAVSNTGNDPFAVQKQQQADAQQAAANQQAAAQVGQGAGAAGAVGGAAAGALIGEIASDDAGKGAAWGAAIGLVRGRRMKREAQEQASQQASAQAQQQQALTQEQLQDFDKAFSVCLEAKDYMVKF